MGSTMHKENSVFYASMAIVPCGAKPPTQALQKFSRKNNTRRKHGANKLSILRYGAARAIVIYLVYPGVLVCLSHIIPNPGGLAT